MNWHLNYTPAPALSKISHKDKILLCGSCFAENIGEKLTAGKFDVLINPNGIVFNPSSLAKSIRSYMRNKPDNVIGFNNGLYYSFDHHGSFSSESKTELEERIKESVNKAHRHLKTSRYLIITFGSAYVYRSAKTAQIVANCHKLPQQEFIKYLLTVDDIIGDYQQLINELRDFNSGLEIIFTVSPVKYLRDGIVWNNLSKAILLQSVHAMVSATSNPKSTLLQYFPAYELVNDDLRDYRFYKEDMAHPNEQAINYVWEKFASTYFDERTKQLNERITEITRAAAHRPVRENTEAHAQFKKTYLQKCEQLEKDFPYIDLKQEKQLFTT